MICLTWILYILIFYVFIIAFITFSYIKFFYYSYNFLNFKWFKVNATKKLKYSVLSSRDSLIYTLYFDILIVSKKKLTKLNTYLLVKDIIILLLLFFKKKRLNFWEVWNLYVTHKIDTIFGEIIIDTNFFFYNYNISRFNLFNYRYVNIYYKNWDNFLLTIKSFYQFKTYFLNKITPQNVLNVGIKSLIFKKPIFNNNKYLIFNLLIFINLGKYVFVPLLVTIIFGFFLIIYFYINLFKQLALWLIIGLLAFWLISGFNFFLKRGRFGKLTSALFRFWKRANMCFWLVEAFLFLLFFYYYLNSSQEPLYMYDYSSLNQTYLPNIYLIYCTTFLLVTTIIYYYYWTLNFPNFTNQQNTLHLLVITSVLVYFYLVESYQFYYVLTVFFENLWIFNNETNLWVLEFEAPRLRVKQQYLILALIAKYWHFVFIFLSWIFFILKVFEQKRAYYTHSGFNLQNLFILFWLNFLFILQWFKWGIRRFLDSIYYWFFSDSNFHIIKYIFTEVNLLVTCDVRHQFYKK